MSINIEAFCKKPGPASKGGLNVGDIVKELQKRGLDTKGNRTELVERLCKAVTAGPVKQTPVKDLTKKQEAEQFKYIQPTEDQLKAIASYDPKRRMINLSGPILRTMSDFVKTGTEYGGMIDINNDGSFDRSIFGIGKKTSVSVKDMFDFEVMFHTHPVGRTAFMFEQPSGSDIWLTMYLSKHQDAAKHQVQVVFTPEGIYTIYADNNIDYTDIQGKQASEAYNKIGASDDIKKVIARIEAISKYGVYVFRYSKFTNLEDLNDEPINNWPESIPLYIDPQEPAITLKKRRVRYKTKQERQARQIKQVAERANDKMLSEIAKNIRQVERAK